MYTITKQQEKENNFKRNMYFFKSARESFEYLLKNLFQDKVILIPAYIGYSSKEGSGIFDPIKNSNIKYKFYKLSLNLSIKKRTLYKLIDTNPNGVLLLVHYFGFQDNDIQEIKKYAKKRGVIIIEDCAHSFFQFFTNSQTNSDYYIFSLHKMFPFKKGGLLLSKKELTIDTNIVYNPFEYDIHAIANTRRKNYNYLVKKLEELPKITILHKKLHKTVPQTLPIVVKSEELRDKLYFKMNKKGFGAVSLYHELISQVDQKKFQNESYLSKHILNLPIHQDAKKRELDKMVTKIKKLMELEYE